MNHALLADRIRSFVTGRDHAWNIVAAARLCADSRTALTKIGPWVDEDGWIEFDRLARHVDDSAWSSGEKALIRLACSLAGHGPDQPTDDWLLGNMLDPLDTTNSHHALDAIGYAALGLNAPR